MPDARQLPRGRTVPAFTRVNDSTRAAVPTNEPGSVNCWGGDQGVRVREPEAPDDVDVLAGTTCGVRIFMRSAGISQREALRSNSDQRAPISADLLTKVRAMN
jgi:hypothetical protein